MMNPQALHETVVTDILDTMRDGIRWLDDNLKPKTPGIERSGSISKATSGLTLVFPHLVSKNCPIEQAMDISKALEQRNISLLQMAFSAYNITNCSDAISHLQKFHTNLGSKVDLDTFVDAMDSLGESSLLYPSNVAVVNEDSRRNANYVLTENINPRSLLGYSEISSIYGSKIIKEADDDGADDTTTDDVDTSDTGSDNSGGRGGGNNNTHHRRLSGKGNNYREKKYDKEKVYQTATTDKVSDLKDRLLPQDAKKANELQPSLMIVNFYVNDRNRDLNIAQQVVAGVKSKMYPIDSSDIIYKIVTKHTDGDLMLKLVKVSTREISFVKDFLLGVDQAKLDAIQKSKRSSSSMFKALEKRALKGRIRKTLRMNNSAKAIASLTITMEEAEEIKKSQNIDVLSPNVIIPIMEKLCLLNFIVVDMASESIMILADGDTEYETLSFSALEKSSGDTTYKKVINLMTKISR